MSQVGQTIGNYKVVQQIGEGGMGVVYLAEHPVIGRKVAIKLLHATFAKDSETVARFFNEARAIHLIAHPNIVEILDFGQTTDGQPYFTMEFLAGEPLADRIARGMIPAVEAVAIGSQICDALQAAHDKGIVHRDLKPHNVYLLDQGPNPLVKILDFGVAKMTTGWDTAQSGGHSVKTRTGSLMGTPLYMSPEQCRGSGTLDHRTDIYSLAVILFEMISGRPPFTAEGIGELFAKHMLEPPPSLAALAPRTPPHIVRAITRALSKELGDRFANMKAFREALNNQPEGTSSQRSRQPAPMSRNHGTGTATLPPEQTTLSSAVSEMEADTADHLPTHSRRMLVIGAVVVMSVVVVALVAFRRNRNPPAAATEVSTPAPAPPVSPTPSAAPETVSLKFDAEPAGAHVFRKVEGRVEPEDLGAVPLELKLPRGDEPTEYLLRAEGHKDHAMSVEPTRDRVLHVSLERQLLADKDKDKDKQKDGKDKRPKPASNRPAKRPVIHDADGLAVPSF